MEGFKTAYEQQGYDVLLTLTFVDGRSITKELADHKLDIFLRQLDRLYFGKIKGKQKTKIEREVFRETKDDQGRRFIHLHRLLKSIGNKELFRHNLQALFKRHIAKAQEADVQFYTQAGHYGIKKDFRHGDVGINNWLQDKGHTDKNTKHYTQAVLEGESEAALKRIYRLHFERPDTNKIKALARQSAFK
jgi:hypothetical protein